MPKPECSNLFHAMQLILPWQYFFIAVSPQ